jgi:hypothetical protein
MLLEDETNNETYLYIGGKFPAPAKIEYAGEVYIRLGLNHLGEIIFARCEGKDKSCLRARLAASLTQFFRRKTRRISFST